MHAARLAEYSALALLPLSATAAVRGDVVASGFSSGPFELSPSSGSFTSYDLFTTSHSGMVWVARAWVGGEEGVFSGFASFSGRSSAGRGLDNYEGIFAYQSASHAGQGTYDASYYGGAFARGVGLSVAWNELLGNGYELSVTINYDFDLVFDEGFNLTGMTFTINSWSYTVEGSAPVPGAGGLAALACGAAGVRKRRRTIS